MQVNPEQIHIEAVQSAKTLKSNQIQMIKVLQLVDQHKVYRHSQCSSLYKYTVHILGLDEHQAFELITVARAAARFDKLQTSLEQGKIKIGKARRLSSVLTKENQEEWINVARTSSQRELERQIAKVNPRAGVKEQAIYVSEKDLALTACVSEETYRLLKRAQDVLSQKRKMSANWDETLKNSLNAFLEKNDPVRKAERALKKKVQRDAARNKQKQSTEQLLGVVGTDCANLKNPEKDSARAERGFANSENHESNTDNKKSRKPLASSLIHQLTDRDQGRCHVERLGLSQCDDERFMHFHHIVPVSHGGADTLENLITLCSGHHPVVHEGVSVN